MGSLTTAEKIAHKYLYGTGLTLAGQQPSSEELAVIRDQLLNLYTKEVIDLMIGRDFSNYDSREAFVKEFYSLLNKLPDAEYIKENFPLEAILGLTVYNPFGISAVEKAIQFSIDCLAQGQKAFSFYIPNSNIEASILVGITCSDSVIFTSNSLIIPQVSNIPGFTGIIYAQSFLLPKSSDLIAALTNLAGVVVSPDGSVQTSDSGVVPVKPVASSLEINEYLSNLSFDSGLCAYLIPLSTDISGGPTISFDSGRDYQTCQVPGLVMNTTLARAQIALGDFIHAYDREGIQVAYTEVNLPDDMVVRDVGKPLFESDSSPLLVYILVAATVNLIAAQYYIRKWLKARQQQPTQQVAVKTLTQISVSELSAVNDQAELENWMYLLDKKIQALRTSVEMSKQQIALVYWWEHNAPGLIRARSKVINSDHQTVLTLLLQYNLMQAKAAPIVEGPLSPGFVEWQKPLNVIIFQVDGTRVSLEALDITKSEHWENITNSFDGVTLPRGVSKLSDTGLSGAIKSLVNATNSTWKLFFGKRLTHDVDTGIYTYQDGNFGIRFKYQWSTNTVTLYLNLQGNLIEEVEPEDVEALDLSQYSGLDLGLDLELDFSEFPAGSYLQPKRDQFVDAVRKLLPYTDKISAYLATFKDLNSGIFNPKATTTSPIIFKAEKGLDLDQEIQAKILEIVALYFAKILLANSSTIAAFTSSAKTIITRFVKDNGLEVKIQTSNKSWVLGAQGYRLQITEVENRQGECQILVVLTKNHHN